jgi:hypothetical protein
MLPDGSFVFFVRKERKSRKKNQKLSLRVFAFFADKKERDEWNGWLHEKSFHSANPATYCVKGENP